MSKTVTTRRIVEITPISGECITMNGPWPTEYIRYSADSWTVTMGESDEQVYACEDLEEAYQQYKLRNLIVYRFGETTPAEWADKAMNRAMIKKTKRPYLRPHLAAVFAEAIKEAKEFTAKELANVKV